MNNLAQLFAKGARGASLAVIRTLLHAGLTVKGTATVASGASTAVVTHGLGRTPLATEIIVNPIEDLQSAAYWWVDTITSTQFTINVNANPTGADVDFVWRADRI